MTDHIQQTIAARAAELGLSAYALAQAARELPDAPQPTKETIRRYLDGNCALNSRYVSLLCQILGLELRPRKRRKNT